MTTPTNPTEAQMKLARECAAHGFPKDMPYYKNCMAGNYDEFGIVQAPLLAIQATEARAQGLVEALTASALRFREYEASHAAKGNLDGDAKARRNCEMAEQCEQALATWRRT